MNGPNIKEEWLDGKRIVELKARQQLELPEAEEVSNFMALLRKDFEIEKLITIVSENIIDRELLNNFLGTVSGEVPTINALQTNFQLPKKQTLPELIIDHGDSDKIPLRQGISSMFRDFSSKVGRIVKRPSRELGTVTP